MKHLQITIVEISSLLFVMETQLLKSQSLTEHSLTIILKDANLHPVPLMRERASQWLLWGSNLANHWLRPLQALLTMLFLPWSCLLRRVWISWESLLGPFVPLLSVDNKIPCSHKGFKAVKRWLWFNLIWLAKHFTLWTDGWPRSIFFLGDANSCRLKPQFVSGWVSVITDLSASNHICCTIKIKINVLYYHCGIL